MDPCLKGLPAGAGDLLGPEIAAQGWNVLREDLPLPLAMLREDALANNSRWMRDFLSRTGALLAPHGKTTLSPELFARQMEDGAWGMTVSTVHHARVARMAGIDRILFANELIGPQEIGWLFAELRADTRFEPLCLVDSIVGVRRLADAAKNAQLDRPLGVLLEIGYAGGRCGCRDLEGALHVARAVASAPELALRGVEGYEGLHQHLSREQGEARVIELLDMIVATAEQLDRENLLAGSPAILSAGGSAFYDLVAERFAAARLGQPAQIILRSGCYLTHDAGLYERSFVALHDRSSIARDVPGRFQNALEVWAYVISMPEPGRAILGAGRRDFGDDAAKPTLLKHFRPGQDRKPSSPPAARIVAINDQHAHVELDEAGDLKIGDLVGLGVSHPCTTFDKWRRLMIVDEQYNVLSAIRTYF